MKILGLSGSLRKGSYNTALLRAAAALMPEGAQLEIGSISGIPLYDGDAEASQGIPPAVQTLKTSITKADGLLLVTPEYKSIPGVFKNAIDWLSRPPADIGKVFGGRPVGVIGASPGGFGTILAQNAWLPVLRTLGTRPCFGNTWPGLLVSLQTAKGVSMRMLLLTLLVAVAGCAGQGGRYQLEATDNTVWRLDTQTGSLDACGFESGKPVCWPFPAPAAKN